MYTRGDEFMKNKKQDEELLKILKQGNKDLILKIIKDYLKQHES